MNNAEKFEEIFGTYATELWAKPEPDLLKWLNQEYNFLESYTQFNNNPLFQSSACKTCSNNPKNGGTGICHCILGTPPITC